MDARHDGQHKERQGLPWIVQERQLDHQTCEIFGMPWTHELDVWTQGLQELVDGWVDCMLGPLWMWSALKGTLEGGND